MATYTITYNVTGNEWVDLNLRESIEGPYDINNVSDFVNEPVNYAGPVIGPFISQAYGYNNFPGPEYLLGTDVSYNGEVQPGEIAVGTISGGEFDVVGGDPYLPGGETSGVTVEAGGLLAIYSGGLDVSASINSGGQEVVRSGGIANGAQITNGGDQEVLGGTASGTIVNSGGQQQVEVEGGGAIERRSIVGELNMSSPMALQPVQRSAVVELSLSMTTVRMLAQRSAAAASSLFSRVAQRAEQ